MSKRLFLDNAYGILGFDASASEREIVRRSKEIDALLKIGNIPDYEYDVLPSEGRRTEKAVSDACQKLLSLEKVIQENFFWFYVKDTTDKKAIKLFKENDYSGALELLKSKTAASTSTIALRNLAVFESLAFSVSHTKKNLMNSLRTWKKVLESDKQWRDFEKLIALNNPNVSHESVESFRKKAEKILSSFYGDVSRSAKKPEIFAEYSKVFTASSQDTIREMIGARITEAKEIIKEIKAFKVVIYVRDDTQRLKNSKALQSLIDALNVCFYNIEQLGDSVYNSSISNTARDEAADAIRTIGSRINNSLDEDIDVSRSLFTMMVGMLEDAYNLCAKDSVLEEKIKIDEKTVRANYDFNRYRYKLESIKTDLERGYRSSAVRGIDDILTDMTISEGFREKVEDLREKISLSHEREPAEYYRLLDEQGEEEVENDDTSEGTSVIRRVHANDSVLKNNGSSSSVPGVIIFLIIVGIIIAIVVASSSISKTNLSNSIKETETICNKYGLSDNSCKNLRKKYNLRCNTQKYSNTIKCEEK